MGVRTAVVLAAGEGVRLQPLTSNRPKPMLLAGNRPILEHVLDALVDAGIERLVVVVGYRRRRVQEHFGPEYRDVPVEYVRQEKQLGSGHALLQAREAVSEPVVVVNGDHLVEGAAVTDAVSAFETDEAGAAMAVIERDDPSKYGAVRVTDSNITEITEKPETDDYRLINAGIYVFGASVFDAIERTPRAAGELALTDTIGRIVARQRVRAVRVGGLWVDATYPWDLLEVTERVLESGRAPEPERSAGVWVDSDALVAGDATLRRPVVVGPDCEIGPNAVVGPNVALGPNATVGANVTVERAILGADSRVDHGSTVVDAVLGQDASVGVGTVIPGGPADVRVDQTVFEDQQLGAVLADRVQVGGGVTFEPGALVGTDARVGSGVTVRGRVADGAEVVR
jgi:UDP-N-acetylglucosamine diphosphorylase/glucosamine-1-phosphate N-acetyltransferase